MVLVNSRVEFDSEEDDEDQLQTLLKPLVKVLHH